MFSYRFWKDIADRLVALILVIITSPLMIAISLAIRFDTKGKAIFAQERVGKDSSNFTVYKFRSMIVNNDETKYKEYISKYVMENAPYRVDETGQKIFKVDDPAVTRVGKWLRKTNLDELPQFFNVLKGDMSFIGPRPDIPFAVAMYNDNQWNRLRVKPGITGLWQVSGRRSRSFTDMVRLDNFYIKKQSLKLDIKILLGTIKVILNMDGS
ncbi:MAG: sugar transferase [Dehalococcoidales bacterium]|nr:sugar transferase [Dehalococcoidales bacterium]